MNHITTKSSNPSLKDHASSKSVKIMKTYDGENFIKNFYVPLFPQ